MPDFWEDISGKSSDLKAAEMSAAFEPHTRNFHAIITSEIFEARTGVEIVPCLEKCADALKARWAGKLQPSFGTAAALGLEPWIGPCNLQGLLIVMSRTRYAITEPREDDPRFAVLHDPQRRKAFAILKFRNQDPSIRRLLFNGTQLVGLEEHLQAFAGHLVNAEPLEVPEVPTVLIEGFMPIWASPPYSFQQIY